MTTHPLTLDRVTYRLPDGRTLFSDLSFTFEPVRTGLVGANGVGKSMLARLLCGAEPPASGRCHGGGRVVLLPALSGEPQGTVAELCGVAPILAALDRIAQGSIDPRDFSLVGDHWDLRERLRLRWAHDGLPTDLHPDDAASRLSGGQAMQAALSGAWASDADWLILDEPSNHLDKRHRSLLQQQLSQWRAGLLVISHDRRLLEGMHCIVELDAHGLQRFSGPYSHYAQTRAAQAASAQAQLEHAHHQHRRQQQQARELEQRAHQQQARGERSARTANQAPILLGLAKRRAQATAGRHARMQEQRLEESAARLRDAASRVAASAELAVFAPDTPHAAQRVAQLERVVLPHGCSAPLDLILQRGQRLAITGDNGSGKSTLLRVLAGQLPPRDGQVHVAVPVALLDQQLAGLAGARSALQALRDAAPQAPMAELRTRLALLGLDAQRIERPFATLSAGERLKAALACALYAEPAPGLLLLDEPGNALDLDALAALETLLVQYRGTLVMVSHDEHLQHAMQPTHTLQVDETGWRLHVHG